MSTARAKAQVDKSGPAGPAGSVAVMTTTTQPTPDDEADARFGFTEIDHRIDAATHSDASVLRVETPDDVIAAIPALLGFVPYRSLVLCLAEQAPDGCGVVLGSVVRHDLDVTGPDALSRLTAALAAIGVQERAIAVFVLIVDDRSAAPCPDRPLPGSGYHGLVHALAEVLWVADVDLVDAWVVRDIAVRCPWWSLLKPDHTGRQSDPATSPIAVAHVLQGRPIRSCRADLVALVAPNPVWQAEIAGLLDAAVAARRRMFGQNNTAASAGRAALEYVLWQTATAENGGRLALKEIADLAIAVRDTAVRDALCALPLTHHARAAEALWAQLCPALSGSDHATVATLLGFSAYTRGDGPLAGIAFQAALTSDPSHALARMLDLALRTGMPPSEVRQLAFSGYRSAAALGVNLCLDWQRWQA